MIQVLTNANHIVFGLKIVRPLISTSSAILNNTSESGFQWFDFGLQERYPINNYH